MSGIWWEPGNFQLEQPRAYGLLTVRPLFACSRWSLSRLPPRLLAIAPLFSDCACSGFGKLTPPSGTYPGRGGKDGRAIPTRRIWSGQPFCRALYQPTLPQMWYKPCPTCFPCRPAPFKQKGKDAEHQAILPNGKIGGKSYGICTYICISATRSTNFSHFRMDTPLPPLLSANL